MSIRTPLAKVKHLGSAKSGTTHFVHQRVSALFMIGLLFWFVYTVMSFLLFPAEQMPDVVTSPVTVIGAVIFIGVFLYHGTLGMRVIIEDYIHSKVMQSAMMIGLYLLSVITFAAGIVTVLVVHFLTRSL